MGEHQKIKRFNLSGQSNSYRAKIKKNVEETVTKGQDSSFKTPSETSCPRTSIGTKTLTSSSEGKNYHINMEKFSELLDSLVQFAKTDIEKLSTRDKENLTAIKQIATNVDDVKIMNEIKDLINKKFPCDSKNMVPKTVEAVLCGCQHPSCHGIPTGCSQFCASSIMGDPSLTGIQPCQDAVYLYKKGVLDILSFGANSNNNAYVYVDSSFTAYTADMIVFLSKNGTKYVKTVYYEGDKCQQMSPDFVSVETIKNELNKLVQNKKNKNTSNNMMWWWWVLVLLALVVLGLVIWAMTSKNRKNGKKSKWSFNKSQDMGDPLLEKALSTTGMTPIASPSFTEGFFDTVLRSYV